MRVRLGFICLLVACGPAALDLPTGPLVASPADALPERPDTQPLGPPLFPETQWISTPPTAPSMALIRRSQPYLTIAMGTRRGNDGAWARPILPYTLRLMALQLRRAIPGEVSMRESRYGAALQITVPTNQLHQAMRALANTLVTDFDPVRAEQQRQAFVASFDRQTHTPVRVLLQNASDRIHGRRFTPEESMRALAAQYGVVGMDRARSCRLERFSPEDMLLVVVGDVDEAELGRAYEETFASVQGSIERRPANPVSVERSNIAVLSRTSSNPQAKLAFVLPAPEATHHDRLAFEMLVELLSGSFTSRLNGSLRETHAYTYGAHGSVDEAPEGDVLFVSSDVNATELRQALREMFRQMEAFRTTPISNGELRISRARVWAGVQAYYSDAGRVLRAWNLEVSGEELARRYRVLENITPEQLLEVAQRHFDPAAGVFVLSGNLSAMEGYGIVRNERGYFLQATQSNETD